MVHLDEKRIVEVLLDGLAFSAAEEEHRSLCVTCAQRVAALAQLRSELVVAKLSQVRPQAEARLFALYDDSSQDGAHPQPMRALLGKLTKWVKALPLWDSRHQMASAGLRSAARSSYRLLFGAQETEVELMVETDNGTLRIVGEVMVPQTEGHNAVALIELMPSPDALNAMETESDPNGRFALEHVPPGRYVMTITPRYSQMMVIEPLELT